MPYYIVPIDAPPFMTPRDVLSRGQWEQADGVTGQKCSNPPCHRLHSRGSRILYDRDGNGGYLCEACVTALTSPKVDAPEYTTRATAARHLKSKQRIDFVPTLEQVSAWREREHTRFDTGMYTNVPWDVTTSLRHYAHMSVETPGHIAYTKDNEAGVLDKQTRVKPGKYLAEFYATRYDKYQIADYIAQCAAYATGVYGIASTKADITAIYNVTSGPDSCMRRKREAEYDWQHLLDQGELPCHPCATYAGPDLAVAYVGKLGEISQRAVIWPDKKQYTRIYGTGPLQRLLQRDGYSKVDALDGARLTAVPFRDGYVVPYMDGCAYGELDDREQYIIVSPDPGNLALDHVNGHTAKYEREDPDEEPLPACANCGESCDDEGDTYCASCNDDHWTCESCSEDYFNNDYTRMASGHLYCSTCVEESTLSCDANDCENTWIEKEEFTYRERSQRRADHVTEYCRACADDHVVAEVTPTPDATPSVEPVRLSGTGWWRSKDRLIGAPGYWHYDGSRGWYYESDGSRRMSSVIYSLTNLDNISGIETVNAPDWYIAPNPIADALRGETHAAL